MSIDVDRGVLAGIASSLDSAATGLDDLEGGVPSNVDAGPMSAVIASMLSQVVNSAGNTSAALQGAAELVRTCSDYYGRADAESSATLSEIESVMDE